jgi:photoactive yellow protein
MSSASPSFSQATFQTVDAMNEEELDALPYGVIQLDTQGTVLRYNAYEGQLAGLTKANVVGRNFFKQVAPCTDVQEFYGRFHDGVAAGKLHCKFRYHFSFKKNPRDVTVTLFFSDRDKTMWVFVQPLEPRA